MTNPSSKSSLGTAPRWTREQIRTARQAPIVPLLQKRGLDLIELDLLHRPVDAPHATDPGGQHAGQLFEQSGAVVRRHFIEHRSGLLAAHRFQQVLLRFRLEVFENVGGEVNAATSTESTSYYARVLRDDVPLAAQWRQGRWLRIADGPDEVHKMVIALRELNRFKPREASVAQAPGSAGRAAPIEA